MVEVDGVLGGSPSSYLTIHGTIMAESRDWGSDINPLNYAAMLVDAEFYSQTNQTICDIENDKRSFTAMDCMRWSSRGACSLSHGVPMADIR